MGLSGTRQLIMIEEMERFGAGRVNDQGLVMLSPLLIQNGSDEQKRFFLPRILSGEHVWAQAYSEPAPDRISPRCASPPAITGTIGCSMGKRPGSRWDRTRTGLLCSPAPATRARSKRVSHFLLVPVDSAGLAVRGITNLDMHDEFAEIFFEDVRVLGALGSASPAPRDGP
ncbi:acyl-CoA dehydrogenase family protein [Bradyrhizobium canariense]|uniref:acyl-CoA dehydrogenase family protein n=1 Tax=Bradyrhizobium canariense TaxID=255045 RepID=UPI001B8A801C|nr:acyl-CoA dehydrogenase family protein [Bradyrhizobium canariense]MBR0954946.1 acyl-CoA dehydrogenase family protein [Bradyrhizobium canariense]